MKKINKYFTEIMDGLHDALEHEKGTKKLRTKNIRVTPIETLTSKDVIQIREKLMLSQSVFAELLGVSKKTIEAWEYGKNVPSGASLRMLNIMMEHPDMIYKYKLLQT